MSEQKIFGIGWHKTGTSTLRECLVKLGYQVCPEEFGYLLSDYVADGDYRAPIILARFYNAFEDSPWNYRDFYQVLDTAFDAKFIYTMRDPELWFESMLRTATMYHTSDSIHMLSTVGLAIVPANRRSAIQSYRDYTTQIQSLPKDKFLCIDWNNCGWQDLCSFLDKPVPDCNLPHMLKYNKSKTVWENHPIATEAADDRP